MLNSSPRTLANIRCSWSFTAERVWPSILKRLRMSGSACLKRALLFMRRCSAANIPSISSTKFSAPTTSTVQWKMLVASLTAMSISPVTKLTPVIDGKTFATQFCTKYPTCGLAISLQWPGGTTFGLMSPSLTWFHSCAWKRPKVLKTSYCPGVSLWTSSSGGYAQTRPIPLTQLRPLATPLLMLKIFLTELVMVKEPAGCARWFTTQVLTCSSLDWKTTSRSTLSKTRLLTSSSPKWPKPTLHSTLSVSATVLRTGPKNGSTLPVARKLNLRSRAIKLFAHRSPTTSKIPHKTSSGARKLK
jgi:hypothetical protein